MKNVSRVIYRKDLNQLGLIGSSELEVWIKMARKGRIENNGDIYKKISEYVEGIISKSGSDVVLGGSYTNIKIEYAQTFGSNLMIFPLYGEKVDYTFKQSPNILINTGEDPKIVCPLSGIHFSPHNAFLFFGENPFESEKYETVKQSIFQGEWALKSFHSKTRRKLMHRVNYFGLGSLEIFVEDKGFL